ncbi:hypothetical protein BB560_005966 [Smittium megazygosporum]|uniref:hydroxymethylbilane synthase n=1 Tax=Smittium megazygosporum TaxID=133381 RepID=A0A2T9YNP3_9FUNG|nr:hypothetical protein BB560_005966 [Smittium megazygosporum]
MPFSSKSSLVSRPVKFDHQKKESFSHSSSATTLLDCYDSTSSESKEQEQLQQVVPTKTVFAVGSRKSALAVLQTKLVIAQLEQFLATKPGTPATSFPLHLMSTTGDKIQSVSLNKIGEKALFTKELEVALASKSVDFVVHSLKDLPTVLPPGMAISAILKRVDPRDVVIMARHNAGMTLADLPRGSVVGTSSVRRIAQLKVLFPALVFSDIRGNLNTRMAKLDSADSNYDAIILAAAGVLRLGPGFADRISQYLDPKHVLYAVGQGALAVETRFDDLDSIDLLSNIVDSKTLLECTAERSLMRNLEGGCSVPLGVCSQWISPNPSSNSDSNFSPNSFVLHLTASISLLDESLGNQLGEIMRGAGADQILARIPKH